MIVNNKFPCCNRGGRLKEELTTVERKCKCQGHTRRWEVRVEKAPEISERMKVTVLRAIWNERD